MQKLLHIVAALIDKPPNNAIVPIKQKITDSDVLFFLKTQTAMTDRTNTHIIPHTIKFKKSSPFYSFSQLPTFLQKH